MRQKRNRRRKEGNKAIGRKLLDYYEGRKNQSNLEDTRRTSRNQNLEPAVCAAQIYCVRDLLVVYLQHLSPHALFFFCYYLWCSGCVSANHVSEYPWPAGPLLGSASSRYSRETESGSRSQWSTWFLYLLQHRLSSEMWPQLPTSVSTWRISPILLPHKYDQHLGRDLSLEVWALTL